MTCTGMKDTDCTECRDRQNDVLTSDGRCINCLKNPEKDPVACQFSVILELSISSEKLVNPNASISLTVSFLNDNKFASRLEEKKIKEALNVKIPSLDSKEYTHDFRLREGKIVLDLFFSKSQENDAVIQLTPIISLILKNKLTGKNELIFRPVTSNLTIPVIKAPDMSLVEALSSTIQSSGKIASSASTASSLISLIAMISSSGFGAHLMKFFRIFKMISRLRLINLDFGTYLELFLSFCSSLFMIGGDDITREALESSPQTRGKLTKYKVTVLSVQVISAKYAVYWLVIVARVIRWKIRKYAIKTKNLDLQDRLINLVAESGRILLLTLIGIDVFFYSIRCVSHIDRTRPFTMDGFISFWLSFFTLILIPLDFLYMVIDNKFCTFESLRLKFRRKMNLELKMKRKEEEMKKRQIEEVFSNENQAPSNSENLSEGIEKQGIMGSSNKLSTSPLM